MTLFLIHLPSTSILDFISETSIGQVLSNLDIHHGTIQTRDHEMSTDPDPQNTFLVFFLYLYLRFWGRNFRPIFTNSRTNILLFNGLEKIVGQNYPKQFTPFCRWVEAGSQHFGFWGPKQYFWKKFPFISHNMAEQMCNPICDWITHLVLYRVSLNS